MKRYSPVRYGRVLSPFRLDDQLIAILAACCFLAALPATLLSVQYGEAYSIIPKIALVLFCLTFVKIRKSMNDLVLIEGLVLLLYTLTPHFGKSGIDQLTLRFGTADGNNLHNVAICGYLFSVFVLLFVTSKDSLNSDAQASVDSSVSISSSVAAILSIALSVAYLIRFGFVIGGEMDYSDTFELKQTQQAGLGFLLLSIPLALASLALGLSTGKRILSPTVFLPLFSFGMLLIVHGQRKYLIIPIMFIGVSRLKIRRTSFILLATLGIAASWAMFCYMGYLRVEKVEISRALDADILQRFLEDSDEYMAGETMALTGTASAAVQGFVRPLPDWGDYVGAITFSTPQFLYATSYVPVNTRFAYAWNANAARRGMGWGFDFWGEAYIVGGMAMVAVAAFVMTALFRFIHIMSTRRYTRGFWPAYAIIGIYYALWFQRNGIAYFVREYLVFASSILLICILLGRSLAIVFAGRGSRLPKRIAPSGHAP